MSTELKKHLTPFQLRAHLEPVHAWQGQGRCCQTHDGDAAALSAIFICQAQAVALAAMSALAALDLIYLAE